jgi:formylglycine-generating enzyme required for sulfatase activity
MVMKFFISWIIAALALQQSVFSTPPERLFYRIVAETNTAIIGWTAELDLTWTNWTTNISYTIQATSDLGNGLTSFWGTVESGQATNLIMTSRAPKPDSPFPPTNSTLLIPAGIFLMGDSYNLLIGNASDTPAHPVRTGAFYMDPTEVTLSKWNEVVNWATNNGYSFEGTATGIDTNYPITTMSWYDCVKWCNARSQKEGFSPVYYSDETHTTLFKEGTNDLGAANVNWKGNGYRLPTEAEWEKAARGGLAQNYYPWPSPGKTNEWIFINPTNANYDATGVMGTTVAASFPPNNYGLFDMAGNVSEWCWDWNVDYQDAFLIDPTGPSNGTLRVTRGGSYASDYSAVRCSARDDNKHPFTTDDPKVGFRCVRSCP